jgi:acyl dehydratase
MRATAPKLGEKLPPQVVGPFGPEDLAAYAAASGDSNPLHLDLGFAQGFGFAARPVHGMKILAAFEPMLADWRPDLAVIGLTGQFLTPVFEGETATLTARVVKLDETANGFVAILRLMAQTQTRAPALMGEARVSPGGG